MNPLVGVGVIVNSALYLLCVFVSGMLQGNPWAWKGAIAAFGLTYLTYFAQSLLYPARAGTEWIYGMAMVLNVAAIILAAVSGLTLLF